MIHPREHEQALAAPERLVERREVLRTLIGYAARPVVVAEEVLDPSRHGLALGEPQDIS